MSIAETATVDYQVLFNIAVTAAAAMGGWVLGRITKSLDRLDEDVRTMPDKYVAKVDYKDDIKDVKDTLAKIYDKLDGKADK